MQGLSGRHSKQAVRLQTGGRHKGYPFGSDPLYDARLSASNHAAAAPTLSAAAAVNVFALAGYTTEVSRW
jgi:hypothetical protein